MSSRARPNPQRAREYPLPICAFDWSQRKGITFTLDGATVHEARTLLDMLSALQTPHLIVGECTFESFRRSGGDFVDECGRLGHLLRQYNPRVTENRRKFLGRKKSDTDDALVIYDAAASGLHFGLVHPAMIADPLEGEYVAAQSAMREEFIRRGSYLARHDTACSELIQARYTPGGYDDYVAEFRQIMPERLEDLSEDVQLAVCTKAGLSDMAVATILVCARLARTRDEFDRLTGWYQNAYPSIMRSNLVFHRGIASVFGDQKRVAGRRPAVKHNRLRSGGRTIFHRYQTWASGEGNKLPATGNQQPAGGPA